jgi:hypothetical protein
MDFFAVPILSTEKIDEKICEKTIKYGRLSTCFALMSLINQIIL